MTRQTKTDNRPAPLQQFSLPEADITLWPQWLADGVQQTLLQKLSNELPWSQDNITIFGKSVPIPRRQVWMGDAHCQYQYSGTRFIPKPWHDEVRALAVQISDFLSLPFNCVLLNYYADGSQHMGWHADNEPELGDNPYIASLSLGALRRFDLKHRHQDYQLNLGLGGGSLLLMGEGCQHAWLHRLPKQSKVTTPRVNLTFRYIKPGG